MSAVGETSLQPAAERDGHEEVLIDNPNNQDLGLRINNSLKIIEIVKGSLCDGKLLPGDHIVQIGDRQVSTVEKAKEALTACSGTVKIKYNRGLQTTTADKIPEDREKLLQRREGFTYHYVRIDYVKGCRFGLGIKHFQNYVLVSRIDSGSLVAHALQEDDHIIDINGVKVTDKDVCRTLLIRSLKKQRYVTMCIERPVSATAKQWATEALNASRLQPPSVALASDVREIAARQQERLMKEFLEKKCTAKPGIMKKSRGSTSSTESIPTKGVKIAAVERMDVAIGCDNEGKLLRKVKP